VHALVDPAKPAAVSDPRLEALAGRWQKYARLMDEADQFVKAAEWAKARVVLRSALERKPGDPRAAARLRMCERRLHPSLPGFETVDKEFDTETGLPRRVRVAGLGITMMLVPGGEFEMGSDRFAASRPVHTVRVDPYYLAEHETTQAEWRLVMNANPSAHQGDKFPEAASMPVEQVSWDDCRLFLQRLNARVTGGAFRLPTEAEWEFAAGPETDEPGGLAAPRPVARGSANKWGLFDMLGNVSEWCSSLLIPYPYVATDGREDPGGAGLRVLRGGSFDAMPSWIGVSARHGERPNRRLPTNGLRIARTVPPLP
jgi:formylglycine-generating enzyme required for sulfatase activity